MITVCNKTRSSIDKPAAVIEQNGANAMMRLCGGIIFPVGLAARIFAGYAKRRSAGTKIIFLQWGMYGEISGDGCSGNARPLRTITQFDIGIVFDTRECGIEHVIVE